MFDVFISYKGACLICVETLGRNLKQQGLTVWLDERQWITGDPAVRSLKAGLWASGAGIVVVPPEAGQSGWCKAKTK